MIRLGLRLALAEGRRSAASIGLTALAVGVATAVLLFAVSFQPALQARDARAAWREAPAPGQAAGSTPTVLMLTLEERFGDRPLIRVLVAATGPEPAVPPGLTRLPSPGEAYVSPALADLMADVPADEIAGRIGRVAGTIGDAGLRSPQELAAVVGVDHAVLDRVGAPVVRFRSDAAPPDLPPIGLLILVLAVVGALMPVAVLVWTASRLTAASREQRLAALRLVGATPAQVAGLAAVEALLCTAIGAPLGAVVFLVARPLVALIPLDGATWFPDTIAPPPVAALGVLVAVQVVGALAAAASMRRLALSPLGVRRRAATRAPRAIRLAPLAAGVAGLLGGLATFRSELAEPLPLAALGAAFGLVVAGIAVAGPWLTALVGRALGRLARGPSALLAARRLSDDPGGSFGSIAGVILAAFVAGAFATFIAYAAAQAGTPVAPLRADAVAADLPASSTVDHAVAARARAVAGVRDVLEVRPVSLGQEDSVELDAWVVPCGQLLARLDLPEARCGPSPIHALLPGASLASSYIVRPADPASDGANPSARLGAAGLDVDALFDVPTGEMAGLPSLLIDPGALGAAAADFPATRLLVRTDGAAATGERVRSAIQALAPTASVRLPADVAWGGTPQFAEIDRIVGLGLLGSLLLAGCSLAVAVTTGLLERRRQLALLRAAGMPVSGLRAVVLIQAGVPLVVASAASALLGVVVAEAVLRLASSSDVPLPDWSMGGILALSLAAAMLLVVATLPAVDRFSRIQSLRIE